MAGKYLRTPARKPKAKPAETTRNQPSSSEALAKDEKITTNNTPAMEEAPIEEQYKDFRKAAEESAKPNTSANEPVLDTSFKKTAPDPKASEASHPFETPTIERDYTDAGIKNKATATPPPQQSAGAQQTASTQQPITDTFEPTPPPPDDDPSYADTHNPQDGPQGEGLGTMNIPRGSAEDLIEFGAKAINYLIGNFAGLLVGVKIRAEYHSIRDEQTSAANMIKEFNDESVEKLKLDSEDMAMLKPPLVKLLQEKGLRGLTTGEELGVALLFIAAKKGKQVMEIKAEGKRLEARFAEMTQYMKGQKTEEGNVENLKTEPKIETVTAEEA